VHSTLEPAHLVLGIKETPLHSLLTSPVRSIYQDALVPRTHMMFSHTYKGQEYNMPLLSRFLAEGDYYADPNLTGEKPIPQLEARLIDYELLTGPDGKRTVAFGWHAGGVCLYYPPTRDTQMRVLSCWDSRGTFCHGAQTLAAWGCLAIPCECPPHVPVRRN
jgi:hypothetical protein